MSGTPGRVSVSDVVKSGVAVRVFVYGTLRSGGAAASLIDGPRWPAELPDFALFGRTGPYPYVVPRPGWVVQGEVAEIPDERLEELDAYEGDEYRRVTAPVRVEGELTAAQVWVAIDQPAESELIPSGDWFDR